MNTLEISLNDQRKVIKMLKAENAKLKKENLILHNRIKELEKDIEHAVGDLADMYQYDDEYY